MAWRSSRTSRSSTLIRTCSSLLAPGRLPWSCSACRAQRRSVSAVQPILPAIDSIAAHCEPCSPWCSSTIRTARSCTSGKTPRTSSWLCPLNGKGLRERRVGSVCVAAPRKGADSDASHDVMRAPAWHRGAGNPPSSHERRPLALRALQHRPRRGQPGRGRLHKPPWLQGRTVSPLEKLRFEIVQSRRRQ